ncbi:DUF2188 domain-containing protein [Alkalicoccus chagannorensis]|uniref:DUF2188 domain-containing protein n=1 Tax=Alkalicoccus chagannorensis TaxID=427072 RepID=UPI0003F77D26|nr:DUF2188 domain-containing protein [Alkalicoccus chagannorensis]
MPWNMTDYPSSLKNLETPVRKKAVDIANTMVEEGYEEGEAIPIATEQAKKWYNSADDHEIEQLLQQAQSEIESADSDGSASPELQDRDVLVEPHENGWAVRTRTAEKPSDVFPTKKEARSRASSIAENKGTNIREYKQDGSRSEP